MKSRYHYAKEIASLREDEELTHVGPGTPMGELLRRYWQPIAYSDGLGDLPRRIRILGEDLVVFRDKRGRVGCLELDCSHRGTSLEFGRVENDGLRCCYHGWLYDVDGKVIEMPCEPPGSAERLGLEHPAYPVMEFGGLVFAYMGPPDKKPHFPTYDVIDLTKRKDVAIRAFDLFQGRAPGWVRDCNWLQVVENVMDPWHLHVLHSVMTGAQMEEVLAERPDISYEETPIGCRFIFKSQHCSGNLFVHSAEIIFPNLIRVPNRKVKGDKPFYEKSQELAWIVPIDDRQVTSFLLCTIPLEYADKPIDFTYFFPPDELGHVKRPGHDLGRPYEDRQRQPDDREAQESIHYGTAIHAREKLVSSDKGVILYRNMLRRELKKMRDGNDPIGIFRDPQLSQGIPTYAYVEVVADDSATGRTR